jgi:hypothetical protein
MLALSLSFAMDTLRAWPIQPPAVMSILQRPTFRGCGGGSWRGIGARRAICLGAGGPANRMRSGSPR